MELPDSVRPGDLVTADLMNRVLGRLASVEQRLDDLDGAPSDDRVAITGLLPSGPLRVGQRVEVLGRNFQFSAGGHRVFFDGVRVDAFDRTSSDTRLVLDVPPLRGLPAGGADVVLTVAGGNRVAERTVRVRPRERALMGNVDIGWVGVEPETPQAGRQLRVEFRLASRASQTATFALSARSSLAGAPPRLLGEDGGPVQELVLEPDGRPMAAFAVLDVPASATGGFTVTVSAASGDVRGSATQPFEVGEEAEPPDGTITLDASAFEPPGAFDGTTIRLAAGDVGRMTLSAEFTEAGTYDVAIGLVDGADGWTLNRTATPSTYVIEPSDFDANGVAGRTPELRLRPDAGATAGAVEVRLQRRGAPSGQSRRFLLDVI